MTGNDDLHRKLEIRIRDSDDPNMAGDSDYVRLLEATLFRTMPGTVNLAIHVMDQDEDNHGGAGINVTLDQFEELVRFVRENQYDA